MAEQIVESYHTTTDSCPPLSTHWGGYDLGKTDWLKKFAQQVSDDRNESFEAWNTVKGKCNASEIIELLYLMTHKGRVYVDESQDAYNSLIAEIEKIRPRYDKLLKDVIGLTTKRRLSLTMPYVCADIIEAFRRVFESKKILEEVSRANIEHGSRKRGMRDWYFFLLCVTLIGPTGRPHIEELATLIDAARIANEECSEPSNVLTLTKRFQRWMKYTDARMIDGRVMFRMNIPTSAQSDDDQIPF